MKKLIIPILIIGLLLLSGCGIQKGDNVECTGGTSGFSGTVIHKKGSYIVLKGVEEYYEYGDRNNCPVEFDKYGNCLWLSYKTGEWVFHKNEDYCKRVGNYDDMIRNTKEEKRRNK